MLALFKRQTTTCSQADFDAGFCGGSSWWNSDVGLAVRYGVIVGFFLLVSLFLLVSWLHANRRLRKNLPPLRYHAWLVSRRRYQPPNMYPAGGPVYYNGQQQAYGMQTWQAPPPAYGAQWEAPPTYAPPQGGSKALANQNVGRAEGEGSASGMVYPPPMHAPSNARITQ